MPLRYTKVGRAARSIAGMTDETRQPDPLPEQDGGPDEGMLPDLPDSAYPDDTEPIPAMTGSAAREPGAALDYDDEPDEDPDDLAGDVVEGDLPLAHLPATQALIDSEGS